MRPTRAQRAILECLANGGHLRHYEGESSLCLVSPNGDWHGRVYGGMRGRLTRNGWLKARRLTDAGRAALEEAN